MRFRYLARFERHGGSWVVEIPGLGCANLNLRARGIADARQLAAHAVTQILHASIARGEELPRSNDSEKLVSGWEWVYPDIRVETAFIVRRMRKERGLTMQQASDAVGVSRSSYQRWEDPKRCNPTIDTLDRITRAFEFHLEIAVR